MSCIFYLSCNLTIVVVIPNPECPFFTLSLRPNFLSLFCVHVFALKNRLLLSISLLFCSSCLRSLIFYSFKVLLVPFANIRDAQLPETNLTPLYCSGVLTYKFYLTLDCAPVCGLLSDA